MLSSRRTARTRLSVTPLEGRDVPSTTLLTNVGGFPNRATVQIASTWDNNNNGVQDATDPTFVGTGTMVSRFQVLTAGHVLFDNDAGTPEMGYARWVTVTPGLDGTRTPFGTASSTSLYVPNAYTTGNDLEDLGVIALNRNVGDQTGWMATGWLGNNLLKKGLYVNMLHYPADEGFDGTRQYGSGGPIDSVTNDVVRYKEENLRSVGGSSGAGVYVYGLTVNGQEWERTIVAINVRSDTGTTGEAEATRLTDTRFNWIRDTLARDRAPINWASAVVSPVARPWSSAYATVGGGTGSSGYAAAAPSLWASTAFSPSTSLYATAAAPAAATMSQYAPAAATYTTAGSGGSLSAAAPAAWETVSTYVPEEEIAAEPVVEVSEPAPEPQVEAPELEAVAALEDVPVVGEEYVEPEYVAEEVVEPGYVADEVVEPEYVADEVVEPGYIAEEYVEEYVEPEYVAEEVVEEVPAAEEVLDAAESVSDGSEWWEEAILLDSPADDPFADELGLFAGVAL